MALDFLGAILENPIGLAIIQIVVVGAIAVYVFKMWGLKKTDIPKMPGIPKPGKLEGIEILEKLTKKEIKARLSALGIKTNGKLRVGYHQIGLLVKETSLKAKVTRQVKGEAGKPKKFEEIDLEFKLIQYSTSTLAKWLKFFGQKYILVGTDMLDQVPDGLTINPQFGLTYFGNIFLVNRLEEQDMMESMIWRENYQEIIGQLTDWPRKLAYLLPQLPLSVEKTNAEINAYEDARKGRMKSYAGG